MFLDSRGPAASQRSPCLLNVFLPPLTCPCCLHVSPAASQCSCCLSRVPAASHTSLLPSFTCPCLTCPCCLSCVPVASPLTCPCCLLCSCLSRVLAASPVPAHVSCCLSRVPALHNLLPPHVLCLQENPAALTCSCCLSLVPASLTLFSVLPAETASCSWRSWSCSHLCLCVDSFSVWGSEIPSFYSSYEI